MIPQIIFALVLALGLGVGGVGLYAKGRTDGRALEQSIDLREREVARLAADSAAAAAAAAISKIKVQNRTVYSEVQREVQTNTVYRDCQHSPEQLRNINAAITGDKPEPAGSGLVPRTDPAGRTNLRRDDAQADRGGGAVPGVQGGGAR